MPAARQRVGGTMYFGIEDFVRLGKAGFPYDATLNVLRKYQRTYKYDIPVAASKLRYVPEPGRQNWGEAKGNRWNRFLHDFYPARVPLDKGPDERFKTLS